MKLDQYKDKCQGPGKGENIEWVAMGREEEAKLKNKIRSTFPIQQMTQPPL